MRLSSTQTAAKILKLLDVASIKNFDLPISKLIKQKWPKINACLDQTRGNLER